VGAARFYAVRGYTYRIALDGLNGASGTYVLNLVQQSTSSFDSRQAISPPPAATPPSIVRTGTSATARRRVLVD
jgi:hypothetical protein